jgi:hypothetical protein
MNQLMKSVNKMCLPAQLYLGVSLITTLALIMQNIGGKNKLCVGHLHGEIPCNNMTIFVIQFFYILIWTWILQRLCTGGYKKISWFLVMLPYITMFLLLLLVILFGQIV